jgi:hypothetical protein
MELKLQSLKVQLGFMLKLNNLNFFSFLSYCQIKILQSKELTGPKPL